jgi:hypothetical protein
MSRLRSLSFMAAFTITAAYYACAAAQPQNNAAPLLVQEGSWKYDSFKSVGNLAHPEEICRIFDHPIFSRDRSELRKLDIINSDFRWDGIEAAPLWVAKRFKDVGVSLDRLALESNTGVVANFNLSRCIGTRAAIDPRFYAILKEFFLPYLEERCFEDQYRVERAVDNSGNLIDKKVLSRKGSCLGFNYNSGRFSDWNSTTFALMLVWREAHPVLLKVFDQGDKILLDRVAVAREKHEQEMQAKAERDQKVRETRAAEDLVWRNYSERPKTTLEQVYNFASTGNPGGERYRKWTEVEECVLSDGRVRIDNRKINMTAFRISRELIGSSWYMVSSDRKMRLSTSANIPVDRLQKAWGLAFEQCPGVTSRF